MTEERDPELQALFAQEYTDLTDQNFTDQVMERVKYDRKMEKQVKILISLFGLALLWVFSPYLIALGGLISEGLNTPIMSTSDGLVDQMVSPMNSYAIAFAIIVLGLNKVRRKIFGHS
jgi:hypothetical protein